MLEEVAVRSVTIRRAILAGVLVCGATAAGCSSSSGGFEVISLGDGGIIVLDSGTGTGPGASHDSGGQPSADTGVTKPPPSADTGVPTMTMMPEASATPDTGGGGTTITSADGFAASREACINKINALRATDTAVALSPLTLQNTATTNSCVDTQATTDESMMSAHYSFINNDPSCDWGSAEAWAQDECANGYDTTPSSIEQCLQDMWDESLKPNCKGCVGCTAFGGACSDCDYSGTLGYECGHYVNMSAPYFTMVACGFAGAAPSSSGSWSVQNFE